MLAYVGNRRGSKEATNTSREIGLIHEAQDYLVTRIDVLTRENTGLREHVTTLERELVASRRDNSSLHAEVSAGRSEIGHLREQVAAMRLELAEALAQHSECERIRSTLEAVIDGLRNGRAG